MDIDKKRMIIQDIKPSKVELFYDIILMEMDGMRALDIPISESEGRLLALAVEETQVQRPLVYDSYLETLRGFGIYLLEVTINKFLDGIFYCVATFVSEQGDILEQDMRVSDALNLAEKACIPVFAAETVLKSVGFNMQLGADPEGKDIEFYLPDCEETHDDKLVDVSINFLYELLQDAVAHEDYEAAARLRDEIRGLEEEKEDTQE